MQLAVKCRKCGAGRTWSPEQVIAALERAGTGDGNSGVNEVGKLIRGTCKGCGYPGWLVEVVRPPVGPGSLPVEMERR